MGAGGARIARARRQLDVARARYEKTWVGDLVAQLKELDFVNWMTIFGAELLWSALPFIILLSSLANERIDDDLSRHIGLNSRAAHIVTTMFRAKPTDSVVPILTGLIFSFAGIVAVVGSLQVLYERAFGLEHRGWRDLPRFVVWVAAFLGAAVAEVAVGEPVRNAAGPVVRGALGFVVVTLFFAWTMHFLLAGRVRWRSVIEPAVVSSGLWLVLSVFSSLYFSSTIISDRRLYGTIGVVFTLLTWFFLIAAVIILGAACGAVWQRRSARRAESSQQQPQSSAGPNNGGR